MKFQLLGIAVLCLVAALMAPLFFHFGEALRPAAATYPAPRSASLGCPLGQRSGAGGRMQGKSAQGVPFAVVTPLNYRAEVAHPLLVVYAPAGFSPGLSERYAGLTHAATAAGFVVSYVGSLRMSLEAVDRMAMVADEVLKTWCIDPSRVYATGHSDGGTMATAVATLPRYREGVRGIVVSGMGWQKLDFDATQCPAAKPVMILHGAQDTHFPGFGRQAAQWWSACNRCTDAGEPSLAQDGNERCHYYQGCAADTVYCEAQRSHWRWAGEPQQVVEFLSHRDRALQP